MKTVIENKIRPLGDRVLAQRIELSDKAEGGIYIPDSAKEKPQEAIVIAVGTGKRRDDGTLQPLEVKKGDRILVSKYGGTETKVGDTTYIILSESDILALIK